MKTVPVLIDRREFSEYSRQSERADVFSRTELEHTFRLLRRSHPGFALQIQNILMTNPLFKPAGLVGEKRTDNFQINLEMDQIKSIISALTTQASVTELKNIQGNITALGNLVILKATLNDWVTLAKLYIDTEGVLEPIIKKVANL